MKIVQYFILCFRGSCVAESALDTLAERAFRLNNTVYRYATLECMHYMLEQNDPA